MNFKTFLNGFIEENGLYRPKDQSFNYYRHFGQRKDNSLFLEYREVLYLFDKFAKLADPELKTYFELKNNDYNILVTNEEQLIYNKTKHFNRNKDIPVAKLSYVNRDNNVLKIFRNMNEKMVFSVIGQADFCLIESEKITKLDKEIDSKMIKTQKCK